MRCEDVLVLLGEAAKVVARTRGVGAGMGDGCGGVSLVGDGAGRGVDVEDDWVAGLLLGLPAERLRRRMLDMGPRLGMVVDVGGPEFGVLDGI